MRAVAGAVLEWTAEGRRFALATVVQTRGSSPRPTGACMAVRDDGLSVGSVSGGCVEGAVITEALSVLGDGRPRLLEFGEASDDGWEVGLSCGGGIQVWVERPALEEDGPDGTGWWDVLRMADEGLACVRVLQDLFSLKFFKVFERRKKFFFFFERSLGQTQGAKTERKKRRV